MLMQVAEKLKPFCGTNTAITHMIYQYVGVVNYSSTDVRIYSCV